MKIVPKEIPYKDRSEFLRGFLILIRQNRTISTYEKNMAMVIGMYFGFDEEFCEESLDYLLGNEFISTEPAVFSDKIIAEYFVTESFNILKQIHHLTSEEINWLRRTAEANQIKTFPT